MLSRTCYYIDRVTAGYSVEPYLSVTLYGQFSIEKGYCPYLCIYCLTLTWYRGKIDTRIFFFVRQEIITLSVFVENPLGGILFSALSLITIYQHTPHKPALLILNLCVS